MAGKGEKALALGFDAILELSLKCLWQLSRIPSNLQSPKLRQFIPCLML